MLLPAYPLKTERLTLRPFAEGDLDDLHAFHSRPEVAYYLYREARDREQTRAVLARKMGQTALREEGDRLVLAGGIARAAAESIAGKVRELVK